MVAMIVGILLLGFTVFASLPGGLNWWSDIINFLRSCSCNISFCGFNCSLHRYCRY